jgi:protein-disulfide isomerase
MYSDFSCPYCIKLRLTLKKLVNDSSGQINWVYRHFPLDGKTSASMRQANAIQCAGNLYGNDRFWELTNHLFNLPQPMPNNINRRITLAAQKSNVNVKGLLDCVDKKTFNQRIIEDQKEAQALGFTGTPGLVFVNNKNHKTIIKQGALTLKNLTLFSSQVVTQ